MSQHEKKVALVTGGAQGIGADIVKVLSLRGIDVAIVDLQKEKAESLAQKLSTSDSCVKSIVADISTSEGCQQAIDQVIHDFGQLDILVNNAAPGRNKAHIGQLSAVDWDSHQRLVLQAVVWLSEFAEPWLKKSGSAAIVNISSVTALKIAPEQCSWPYHVSKAGLEQLTRYLACRLGADNIRINAVAPGLVDRDGEAKISDAPVNRRIIEKTVPLMRAGKAMEIGKIVAFLCSDDSSYMTGQIITADGGLGIKENFGAGLSVAQDL